MSSYPALNASTASEFIGEPTALSPSPPLINNSAANSVLEPENDEDIEEFSEEEIIEQDVEEIKTINETIISDPVEVEEPKVEEPKVEEPKVEEPKVEVPKVEVPKVEEPKIEEPKAKVNDTDKENVEEKIIDATEAVPIPKKLPNLKDLPTLGNSAALAPHPINWGPNMKQNATSIPPLQALSTFPSVQKTDAKPMRSKHMQVTFKIDSESQINVTKEQYTKVVEDVKKKFSVAVESTVSKTHRTFLVSGNRSKVNDAKIELLKGFQKPIQTTFTIPTSCRAAVIGMSGKTVRDLTEKYSVRIHVNAEPEPETFNEDTNDTATNITLFGAPDSSKIVKTQILAIVKEELKNATLRFNIDNEEITPFINLKDITTKANKLSVKCTYYSKSKQVVITGEIEAAKSILQDLKLYLSELENSLVTQKHKIPYKFQILIDAKLIKDLYSVTVELPTASENEMVSFIGHKEDVNKAVEFARETSKSHVIETLNISKSHNNNVDHAKKLMMYLKKYNVSELIKDIPEEVRVVLPSDEQLKQLQEVNIYIIAKSSNSGDLKFARKEIIHFVNQISPEITRTVSDLDYELFGRDIAKALLPLDPEVRFALVGDYIENNNDVFLVFPSSDDDFQPSKEETEEQFTVANNSLNPLRDAQKSLSSENFDCDGKIQDDLLTGDSKTLSLIMNEVAEQDGHIQIKSHYPEYNQIFVRGNERAFKVVNKALKLIIAYPETNYTTELKVPESVLSRFIGNKGANIQSARSNYGVTIVIPESDGKNNKEHTVVSVVGLRYNVARATEFLNSEIKKWSDIITKELSAPNQFRRAVIGGQRNNLTRMQDKFDVRINYPPESNILTIRGPSRQVGKAYDELKELIDFEMAHNNKTIIKIPVQHIPRVIGKNGQHINDMRAEFGVEMDFVQDTTKSEVKEGKEVDLEIIGDREAIKEASAKVQSILFLTTNFVTENIEVDQKYFREIIGPNGQTLKDIISKSGGDSININRPINIPKTGSKENVITVQGPKDFVKNAIERIKQIVSDIDRTVTKEIVVAPENLGALIGPVGTTRRALESEFNVSLEIPNRGDTNSKVKISGLAENIEKVERKIFDEILKERFDDKIEIPHNVLEYVSQRGALLQSLRLNQFVNVRYVSNTAMIGRLSSPKLDIPVEKARGTAEEKLKLTFDTVEIDPELSSDKVEWTLTYEPIEIDGVLSNDAALKDAASKKQDMLKQAKQRINDRIESASGATSVAYIWCKDPSKFNLLIGPVGTRINKLRDSSECIIVIPKRNQSVNDIVYVRGEKSKVEKVANDMMNVLRN